MLLVFGRLRQDVHSYVDDNEFSPGDVHIVSPVDVHFSRRRIFKKILPFLPISMINVGSEEGDNFIFEANQVERHIDL